jgi:hypothetical protein
MRFNNGWMIYSSYDIEAHSQCSQETSNVSRLPYSDLRFFQTGRQHTKVSCLCSRVCCRPLHLFADVYIICSGTEHCSQTYRNDFHGTHDSVVGDLRYSEDWLECPPRVWYSPEIDAFKFTLHILSDSLGCSQRLQFILLMQICYKLATSFGSAFTGSNR